MDKIDEVVNVWLDEMAQEGPHFESFEKSIVPDAATIKEGNMVEAISIGYTDEKNAMKSKRLAKKRWKLFEKVEGFSFTINVYETKMDDQYKDRYKKWKEAMKLNFGDFKEIF